MMFENVKWLFFDVGSTLMNEEKAYEHRMREMAEAAKMPYEKIYEMAIGFYKENKKGDLETARLLGLSKPPWHKEDECLYEGARECLEALSEKYKIGVIANQSLGTAERLEESGIRQYIDLVIASAEEGVAKPDRRIFEIALERGGCKPSEAVMIGDRIDNDIVPAKLLGMHTIWVRQGFSKYWKISSEIEKAEAVVDSLEECCILLLDSGGL
ncbi:MAG: HAD family hydrolase [Oscillospiraceae bacterium]|nr:HAD family hydrolase [Oscillospiraceae bacterium]